MPSSRLFTTCCAIFALLASPAGAETLKARYTLSLIGLTVGQAGINATFTPSTYKLEGSARVSGIAAIVSSSKGAVTATGTINGTHLSPNAFAVTAANAQMSRTIRMALASNAAKAIEIEPPFDPSPDRIPLSAGDQRGIVDPMSALLMPTTDGDVNSPSACNRTLPVFDGGARFDITMTYKSTEHVEGNGYSGPVAVCAVRYTPIAGHRRNRKPTQYMADNKDMEIWLAPVGNTHLLMPYHAAVMTMAGRAQMDATEFSVSGDATAKGK
ncbi:DUF3108 domain-containing protein [Methylovirgula sp. 4M-Z18]|uniref:DUF3108 domain-containing protein n=1 Tax=Methylovirgula sp. 4M-Z18 TaxID=2293567 RepID=UPI000E39B95A|nr:DUF3108 domain-containing protein [Methylovirgula sp. 4M-Z18]RFB74978.1 DUF3108 domain-containing protein [Methylovirgula sp. 4M-Z18]